MLRSHVVICSIALLLGCAGMRGQGANEPTVSPEVMHSELPPSAIYSETLAPFERTRSDLGNWSEVELAAFHTATDTAKTECLRLEQYPHEGEEALALARLCSIGLDWDGTYSAARWYTRKSAPGGEASHLALGYGLLLQADLNLQAVPRVIDDLAEIRGRLPLSADTDSIFTYAISLLEIMQPDRGLEAALMRQPALLEVIAGRSSAEPALRPGVAVDEAWHTVTLLHLAQRVEDEAHAKSELLEALDQRTVASSTTDRYMGQRARKRYEWLEQPAPEIHVSRNTYPFPRGDALPARAELMVIERVDAADAAMLALGVDALRTRLPKGASATMVLLEPHAAVTLQQHVSSPPIHAVYTKDDLISALDATDGPLFVVRNGQHRVKYLGAGSLAWLNPHMQAERLIGSNLGQ